jgi:lipoprotein NlpD
LSVVKRAAAAAATAFLVSAVPGCGGSGALAPVDSFDIVSTAGPSTHTVKRGETLYSIAWLYGLDYRHLATHNGIREPFIIYPGQRLNISGTRAQADVPSPSRPDAEDQASGAGWKPLEGPQPKSPASPEPPTPRVSPKRSEPARAAASGVSREKATSRGSASGSEVKDWMWPTEGTLITDFAGSGRKGLNITGRPGQSVVAAADGRVVYAGGGLRGYGELIIVKHNKRFLSAYAHNNRVLVKEGDKVKVGQRIAEMGSTGTDKVMLHFEIRRDGKPVDPVRYLPK